MCNHRMVPGYIINLAIDDREIKVFHVFRAVNNS